LAQSIGLSQVNPGLNGVSAVSNLEQVCSLSIARIRLQYGKLPGHRRTVSD